MSRALGDWHLKLPRRLVSNVPDVKFFTLSGARTSEYAIILASDGLWDVVSNYEAARLVKDSSHWTDDDPKGAAEMLVKTALQRGTQDNVTAMVVFVNRQPTAFVEEPSDAATATVRSRL